jgi:hypothetical protein
MRSFVLAVVSLSLVQQPRFGKRRLSHTVGSERWYGSWAIEAEVERKTDAAIRTF